MLQKHVLFSLSSFLVFILLLWVVFDVSPFFFIFVFFAMCAFSMIMMMVFGNNERRRREIFLDREFSKLEFLLSTPQFIRKNETYI